MYKILPYTLSQAKRLNVKVRSSNKADKKIDVFDKSGKFVTSVGARGYLDYPTYKKLFGKTVADQRRKLYKARHEKDRKVKGTPGYFADQLLW
jgi:putative heme degradation protein